MAPARGCGRSRAKLCRSSSFPLLGGSTFQTALELLGNCALFEPAVVITNHDYRFLATEQAKETGVAADIAREASRAIPAWRSL